MLLQKCCFPSSKQLTFMLSVESPRNSPVGGGMTRSSPTGYKVYRPECVSVFHFPNAAAVPLRHNQTKAIVLSLNAYQLMAHR